MKSMNANETVLVRGGQTEDFWTIQIHEFPRFENPPTRLTREIDPSPRNGGCRPTRPQPMHWLPHDGSGPQEY